MDHFALTGRLASGINAASQAIPLQLKFFREHMPELMDCFLGTLNIQFDNILIIENPDFYFPKIAWTTNFSEDFGFLRIRLQVTRIQLESSGFIYVAYSSPHRKNP